MARNGTSGIIWISVALMVVSITTSTMGLFMDSWRNASDESEMGDNGWGLTSISYDCSAVDDKDEREMCRSTLIFMVMEYEDVVSKYDTVDDLPSEGSVDTSELCNNFEKLGEAAGETDDPDFKDNMQDCEDSVAAGDTGAIVLWIGLGLAIISVILCIITSISNDSSSRIGGGLAGLFSGLAMGLSVLIWSLMLPNGIAGGDDDWEAGLNFYLTLVGGFLSLVAGIIALLAKKRGGGNYNYHTPQQQNYQQQNYQQQQQFYEEQTQHYQQPDPYQQW